MAPPSTSNRPLSPHLQVYKPQITSVLSILHRFTGMGLCVGMGFFIYWLSSLAAGEASYSKSCDFFGSFFGMISLFCILFSFFYHLANGLRHLMWDSGHGYDLTSVHKTGWMVVFCTLILTLSTWFLIFS